jgi:hypothetical protein
MRLVQFTTESGLHRVGLVEPEFGTVAILADYPSVYELALSAARNGRRLAAHAEHAGIENTVEYPELIATARLRPPLDHPDPTRCLVTGTGLTHVASAEARDAMHRAQAAEVQDLSDSMKMFRRGIEGGKPAPGEIGVVPEWFYKGDGGVLVAPGAPLPSPAFALDGSEEAEIAALYVVDDSGTPRRVGFALGNEFSDHELERQNYLYLATSKLRSCAVGPELLPGDLPDQVAGTVRVRRDDRILFEAPWQSGEANMCHSLANLEHHHFKYPWFRRPGTVHIHFLGAAVLSFGAGIRTQAGDLFEIESPLFGAPLRNPLAVAEDEGLIRVEPL